MLSVAEVESASADEPNVQAFARKVFQGQCATPVGDSDKKLWFGRVRQVLSAMQKSNSETTYECEPEQSWKDGLCSKGAIAVTILNIHLCPNWWTLRSVDDRAFVLLHEWAHRYDPSVNQVFETYCDSAEFGGPSAGDLVAEPDAHAGYIFELVTGNAPPPRCAERRWCRAGGRRRRRTPAPSGHRITTTDTPGGNGRNISLHPWPNAPSRH